MPPGPDVPQDRAITPKAWLPATSPLMTARTAPPAAMAAAAETADPRTSRSEGGQGRSTHGLNVASIAKSLSSRLYARAGGRPTRASTPVPDAVAGRNPRV